MPKIAQEYTLDKIYNLLKRAGSNPMLSLYIAQGLYPGITAFRKFGRNAAIGTTTTPITTSGFYQTPTSVTSLEVVSSDVNDTYTAGSGAREVQIIGLDGQWNEVSQIVRMNGTTAVAVPTSLIRVYSMVVYSSGTYATQSSGSHVGTITLRVSGAGATWSQIGFMNTYPTGQSMTACYTVPAGYTLFTNEYIVNADSTKSITVMLFERSGCNTTSEPFSPMKIRGSWDSISGSIQESESQFNVFTQYTDVGFVGYVGSGTAAVSCNFSGFLVKNTSIKKIVL